MSLGIVQAMIDSKKNSHSIQVIDRMSQLLDLIADYENGVTLKILTADAGLHPSTAFRILASLTDHGFVERDANGRYRLGSRLSQLGALAARHVDIREQAKDLLSELRDEVGETVNLLVREGNEVVYVERATVNRMMRVEQIVGGRALLHITAVGKLMLAEMTDTSIARYARQTRLKRYTSNTITTLDALYDAVKMARAQGYAFDDEEAERGVGCVGVLVKYQNRMDQLGISISAPINRRSNQWIESLRRTSEILSQRLNGQG